MKKILVIEDDNNIRENISEILMLKGFDTAEAANGKLGVEVAVTFKPDLIICDIMMPEMDGYGVLKFIRNNEELSGVPFLFLSAKADRQDLRAGMELGANDYITKPFTIDDLIHAIQSQMDRMDKHEMDTTKKIIDSHKLVVHGTTSEYRDLTRIILNTTGLLLSHYQSFDKVGIMEMINNIQNAALRLDTLHENILYYSYIQEFNSGFKTDFIDTNQTTEVDAGFFEKIISAITERYNRRTDYKIKADKALVRISSEHLKKIVQELVDNAYKFSMEGTLVSVKGIAHRHSYNLTISDKGRGIDSFDVAEISPFKLFGSIKNAQKGIGLGLYIAKTLTELNQGHFDAVSEHLGGTEITITLKMK